METISRSLYYRYIDILMNKCVLASTPESTMRTVSQTSEGVAITTLVNSVSMTGSIMTTRLTNEDEAVTTQEEPASSNVDGLELTDLVLSDAEYTTMESLGPECK